jgi:hypothetical protein
MKAPDKSSKAAKRHFWDQAAIDLIRKIERRGRDEAQERAMRRWQTAVFAVLSFAVVGLATWSWIVEDAARSRIDERLILPSQDWRAVYAEGGFCSDSAPVGKECFAHPDNPTLWEAKDRRTDDSASAISPVHAENVKERRGKVYWIGTAISPLLLQKAGVDANWLVLGWVTGSYRVFVDGVELSAGQAVDNRLSLHLAIPKPRMLEDRPLMVAIRILHDAGAKFPDILARGKEHFATSGGMSGWERLRVFNTESKPLALSGLNAAVAALFLLLWRFSKQRREFFYMAAYAFIQAGIQLTLVDGVYNNIRPALDFTDIMLRVLEGGLGLLLALAFVRVRSHLIRNSGVSLMSLGLAMAAFAYATDLVHMANALVGILVVPMCYGTGAILCYATTRRLILDPPPQHVPHRVRRLEMIAVCFVVMASLYALQAIEIAGPNFVSAHRLLHAALIAVIIAVLLFDVAEQESIIDGLPIPRWHRQVPMPDQVFGAVTKADMKGSQAIKEQRGDNIYEQATYGWYRRIAEEVFRRGGEVTFDEGDCIIAVCEQTKDSANSVERLIEAHAAAFLALPDLAESLETPPLAYRAAIAEGVIKPRWKTMLGFKRPAFASTDVLVEVAALMESERDLEKIPHMTRVVLSQTLLWKIRPALRERMQLKAASLTDKRGNTRQVAVWELDRDRARAVLDRETAAGSPSDEQLPTAS